MHGSRPAMTSDPGVTGLWQVEERDNGSFEAYRRLDLYYVENWSLLLDLTILVHTVPAVIGRGWRALRPADRSAVTSLAAPAVAVALEPVEACPSRICNRRRLTVILHQSTICRYGSRAGSKCEARSGVSARSPGAGVVRPTPPGGHFSHR